MTTEAITGPACRAARALLRWSVRDLVSAAGVSPNTVGRLEADGSIGEEPSRRIADAFASAGVDVFGPAQPGARLQQPQ